MDGVEGAGASLERFVPRVASEWALDAGDRRWQEVDGTLCFIDISGFTALSERLAARGRIGVEELTDLLHRVFGTMLDLAFARQGALLKFGGDALLLLFTGDDHPVQAASAAVEMRAALRDATRTPLSVGKVTLRMSVGLHAGTVHLYRAGADHQELLVTGPAATRTTQMEHAASAGEILVSPELAALLPATATRPGPAGGRLLRWRRAPLPPAGGVPRRSVPDEDLAAWVPRLLREHLAHGAADFEHRIAVVAFLRFRGVDRLLAERGPDAVAAALDRLVRTVQAAADDEEVAFLATDLDEDGGKVILVAGVPRARTDDEGRMLRVVRAIVDADLPLDVHLGVHHGHVFAGTVGAEHRATFTVMGDTVNLAARLMAAAPPGEVYATLGVLDRSRHVFEARAIPPFTVKGKAQPVQAFAVGGEVGSREASVDVGPFVGRAAELDALAAVLDRDRDDAAGPDGAAAPPVVTVIGETGIGKSRLVAEAIGRAGRPSFVVRGEPDGTTSAYRAVRDSVRSLLGVERAGQATMRARLEASVAALDPGLLPFLPLVGSLAHVDVLPTPEVDAIEPRFLPDQVAATLTRLLAAAIPGPAAIVVEDAQWTDAASDALLGRLALAAEAGGPWSVVVVRRDVAGGFAPESRLVPVGPLEDASMRQLLTALTSVPLRPDEIDRLLGRAAGSPLVLDALVRLGRERGGLDDLPDSLEEVIAAEIDVLAPMPRTLLRYAAVLGRSFNPLVGQELVADLGLSLDDAALGDLRRFLDFGPDRVTFRQAVVRDVAYGGLPYRRRRELHLRAGEVIERIAAGAVDAVADLLSLHFHEGGEHEKAWRYARLAGDAALAGFANAEAAALYRRALDAARRLPDVDEDAVVATWMSLGDALKRAGHFDDAHDAYRKATALVRGDRVAEARTLLRRARVRERAGSFTAALVALKAAERAVAGEAGPEAERTRVRAATLRAIVHEGQEQPRRALRAAEQAAAAAEAFGEDAELARALSVVDWAHMSLGDLDRATHEPQVAAIWQALDRPHKAAAALGNQGALEYFAGRWSDALSSYRRAHEVLVQTGDVVNAAIQQGNIAELLANRGRHQDALDAAVEGARTLRAVGYTGGALFAEIQLGRLQLASGDTDRAGETLASVVDEAADLGLQGTVLEASVHLASCRIAEGRPGDAIDLLAEGERAAGDEAALYTAAVELVRSRALAALGDDEGAARSRAVGIAAARRSELRYELGLLLVLEDDDAAREEGRALLAELDVDPVLVSG